ncbi:Peptide methionine sulfoxide reductase MrsB [Trinorchestia longiramus]|nr:Peptide methionine sulfoxide reductase MrsB [Trinorchestia longiramus]
MKMVRQILKHLFFGTRTCLQGVRTLSYRHSTIFHSTASTGRKSSLLSYKLPALTFATLITVKFPSVMSTGHNTEYCSSYSSSCGTGPNEPTDTKHTDGSTQNLKNSPQDPKKILSPLQYHVTQEAGTERAFTGKYYDHWEHGIYTCMLCGASLFGSESKYDSGSGWPSFHSPYTAAQGDDQHSVVTLRDTSHGMVRDEVRCKKCGSHLGHVFDDGPPPSGLRYCINSAALNFKKHEK